MIKMNPIGTNNVRNRILPPHVYRSKSGNYSVKLKMFSRNFRIGANYQQPEDASTVAKNALLHCRVSPRGILSLSKKILKLGKCNTLEKSTIHEKDLHSILRKFIRVENTKWILAKKKLNEKEVGITKLKTQEEVHLLKSMKDVYVSDLGALKRRLGHVYKCINGVAISVGENEQSLYEDCCSTMSLISSSMTVEERYKMKDSAILKVISPQKRLVCAKRI